MSPILSRTSLLLGVIAFLSWAPAPSMQNHYCSISKDHTLCKYQGIGPRCKNPYEIGIPAADRRQIMQLHNSLRQLVATGGERRGRPGPQPSAANMLQLEWDNELAASAQRLAEQCRYTHDCLNCRKVDRFLTGQNLYQFSENLIREGSNWEQAIMAWYDEVARFNPRSVDYFEFIKELGHYTQMLWAETYKMGCGYAYYNDGKWNRKLYVCNYGPAGNVITTEMYKRGAPCSACPEGTFCSQQYPGLCTSGSSGHSNSFPRISHVPEPTTRRTTTTTTRRTTTTTTRRPTTTTTTPRPAPSRIFFNEIESNEIEGGNNIISTRLGGFGSSSNNRFSGKQQQKQQQFSRNQNLPSSHSGTFTGFSAQINTNSRFSKPVQTITVTTTTTTRRPTTTSLAKISTKKPFTFSPRIFPESQNRQSTTSRQQQIHDNRISPVASGTIQVSQTQKNQFSSSSDINRFSSKPTHSNNRLTTSSNGNNRNNYSHNRAGTGGSAVGPRAETKILRINESPAYSLEDTNSIVLFCDFDYAKCPVRSRGQSWDYTTYQTPGFGKGFATVVEGGKQSNLEIRTVMDGSGDGSVCLYFRFVNFIFGSDGGQARSSGLGPDGRPLKFSVTVTTAKQVKKSVEITDRSNSALDWLTAKVQFTDLHSMFLLIFEVPRNPLPDNVYLAVDDILLTKGRCHM